MNQGETSINEKVIQQLLESAEVKEPPTRVLQASNGEFWEVLLPTPLAFSMEMFYGRDPNRMVIPVSKIKMEPGQRAMPGRA